MMKLVEDSSGIGELRLDGEPLHEVRYRIRRYQGMSEGSGLPIPGLHRTEGSIEIDAARELADFIGIPLDLKLEDDRIIRISVVDSFGRILTEGHGPSKCGCC